MNDTILQPEVRFRVGPIRVTLWRSSVLHRHQVTVEQEIQGFPGQYGDAIDASELSKAVLALKKAHDYLDRKRAEPATVGDFHSAAIYVEERIP